MPVEAAFTTIAIASLLDSRRVKNAKSIMIAFDDEWTPPRSMTNILVYLKEPEKSAMRFEDLIPERCPGVTVKAFDDAVSARSFLPQADVMVTLGAHLGSDASDIFERAKNLKWVQVIGTGVDNVKDHPALHPDVIVTSAHGIHGPQMSEAAICAMLALSRQLPRIVRNQDNRSWDRFPASMISGKTVGVVGIGAIGETLGPLCKALGMRVMGFSSGPRETAGYDVMHHRDALRAHVHEVDFLVLLTPLSAMTRNLIDADILRAMTPTSFLINLARGGVVDEDALVEALTQGWIAGAALDVFVNEPLPRASPFWMMDNVIVTPHLGGFHDHYSDQVVDVLAANLKRYLADGGLTLRNHQPA